MSSVEGSVATISTVIITRKERVVGEPDEVKVDGIFSSHIKILSKTGD